MLNVLMSGRVEGRERSVKQERCQKDGKRTDHPEGREVGGGGKVSVLQDTTAVF